MSPAFEIGSQHELIHAITNSTPKPKVSEVILEALGNNNMHSDSKTCCGSLKTEN